MSTLVIDCSVVGPWVIPDEKTPESQRLLLDFLEGRIQLFAPFLLQTELANILKTNIKRGRISRENVESIFQGFIQLPIQYVPVDPQLALKNALAHNLTVYDATYFTLAKTTQHQLLTTDKDLLTAYLSSSNTLNEPRPKYRTR